jgi:hypothetical protein
MSRNLKVLVIIIILLVGVLLFFVRRLERKKDYASVSLTPLVGDIRIRYIYPHYTGLKDRAVHCFSGELLPLKGTVVEIQARPIIKVIDGDLVFGNKQRKKIKVDPLSNIIKVSFKANREKRYRFEFLTLRGQIIKESLWRHITVKEDLPPRVLLLEPLQHLKASSNSNIKLSFELYDDFGLKEVYLVWQTRKTKLEHRELLRRFKKRTYRYRGSWIWKLSKMKLRGVHEISFWLEASDNNPLSGGQWGVSQDRHLTITQDEFFLFQEYQARIINTLFDLLADRLEKDLTKKKIFYQIRQKSIVLNEMLDEYIEKLRERDSKGQLLSILTSIKERLLTFQEKEDKVYLKNFRMFKKVSESFIQEIEESIIMLKNIMKRHQAKVILSTIKQVQKSLKQLENEFASYRRHLYFFNREKIVELLTILEDNIRALILDINYTFPLEIFSRFRKLIFRKDFQRASEELLKIKSELSMLIEEVTIHLSTSFPLSKSYYKEINLILNRIISMEDYQTQGIKGLTKLYFQYQAQVKRRTKGLLNSELFSFFPKSSPFYLRIEELKIAILKGNLQESLNYVREILLGIKAGAKGLKKIEKRLLSLEEEMEKIKNKLSFQYQKSIGFQIQRRERFLNMVQRLLASIQKEEGQIVVHTLSLSLKRVIEFIRSSTEMLKDFRLDDTLYLDKEILREIRNLKQRFFLFKSPILITLESNKRFFPSLISRKRSTLPLVKKEEILKVWQKGLPLLDRQEVQRYYEALLNQ